MQAFKTKVDCGQAMLQWGGSPEDPVAQVARSFLNNEDVKSITLLEGVRKTITALRYVSFPTVTDESRSDLESIESFLSTYIAGKSG